MLAKPNDGDIPYLYLAVTKVAVSAVLVKEENNIQKQAYYTSKVLHGAELRYKTIEKFTFALVIAVKKLRPYF